MLYQTVLKLLFITVVIDSSQFKLYENSDYLESNKTYNIIINASKSVDKLDHFWESTGFCPPDPHQEFYRFILSDDELQNIAYIGSVPNQGIKQVRIHWLLDLITMTRTENDRNVEYNFTYLDKAMDLLINNGLRPGFELMGNPSNYFSDFDDVQQIFAWRDLISASANHLVGRYGIEEVSSWNFESWNEPQNRKHFDGLHVTLQGYLKYYDACVEGLKAVHSSLTFGGPATGLPATHPIFWAILQHCYNGTNFFTEERGVKLDFISFHIKGEGHSNLIVQKELQTLSKIKALYPLFMRKSFYNDEGDPLVGWSKGENWRADARYPAIVVKILAQHQNLFRKTYDIRYRLLSNDNGFMNYHPYYFSQRTLLARFQMNQSHPRKVEFIKKPILSVMGLLSLLGTHQLESHVIFGDKKVANTSDLGVLSTVYKPLSNDVNRDWELAVIVYNSNDTSNKSSFDNVNISVSDLPTDKELVFAVYSLDNNNGNPYKLWKKQGSPVFPTDSQLRKLRNHQEPVRVEGPSSWPHGAQFFNWFMAVQLPSVSLVHLCAKPLKQPSKVEQVRLYPVSPYEILVTWKDVLARCLETYQVLYSSKSSEGPFVRVNKMDLIFTAFHHTQTDPDFASRRNTVGGWYQVVAVDYWGRRSSPSDPVPAPFM